MTTETRNISCNDNLVTGVFFSKGRTLAPDVEEAALVFIDGINKYNSKKADKNIPPPPRCTQRFELDGIQSSAAGQNQEWCVNLLFYMIINYNNLVGYHTQLHFLNYYSLSVVAI